MKRGIACGLWLWLWLLFSGQLLAQQADCMLYGPDVSRLDWNTYSLLSADFDEDGMIDLACINNDRAQIDILYQRELGESDEPIEEPSADQWEPVWDHTRFRKDKLVTGDIMASLVSADFNGDGRFDFAYTSKDGGLSLWYYGDSLWRQSEDFEEVELPFAQGVLAAGWINEDERSDLVAMGKDFLYVLLQDEEGVLALSQKYRLDAENLRGLRLLDMNGDGRLDLSYLAGWGDERVRMRLQQENGLFGPEIALAARPKGGQWVGLTGMQEGEPRFAYIDDKTQLVREVALRLVESTEKESLVQVSRYPTAASDRSHGFLPFDHNRDGRLDVLVTNAKAAYAEIYEQNEDNHFTSTQRVELFHDVVKMQHAAGHPDKEFLLMLTEEEGMLAYAERSRQAESLDWSFPVPFEIEGVCQDFVAAALFAEGRDELLYIREETSESVLHYSTGGIESWSGAKELSLGKVRRSFQGIWVGFLNADELADVVVFIEKSPARIFIQEANEELVEVAENSILRDTLLRDVSPGQLGQLDLNGDGQDEVVLAAKGLLRSLAIDENGNLVVLQQVTVSENQDVLSEPMMVDFDGEPGLEIVVYNESEGELVVLGGEGRDDVQRYDVGYFDLSGMALMGNRLGGEQALLFLGEAGFYAVSWGGSVWQLQDLASYEPPALSPSEQVRFDRLYAGDLLGDSAAEWVGLDSRYQYLSVVSEQEDDWQERLGFKVFKSNPHFQGRKGQKREPREVLIADVTSDGKADVVLLIHDRLLVYRQ